MTRNTYTASAKSEIAQSLRALRDALDPQDGTPGDTALCEVETYIAIASLVLRRANPSTVRDCARIVEIRARIDGVPVVERNAA